MTEGEAVLPVWPGRYDRTAGGLAVHSLDTVLVSPLSLRGAQTCHGVRRCAATGVLGLLLVVMLHSLTCLCPGFAYGLCPINETVVYGITAVPYWFVRDAPW